MFYKLRFEIRLVGVLLLFFSCSTSKEDKPIELEAFNLIGSWEMKSVQWITADTTYTIAKTQPGILMIDKNRYSLIWTPVREARIPFIKLSEPTDEEITAAFRSIVFNSGTYTYTDSTLTTKAVIAKVPGFEGGKQFYRYKWNNRQLELTMFDETYPDGSKPDWSGIFTTQFNFERVD